MKIKYLYVLVVMMMVMPLVANAATVSVSINCTPNEINGGEGTACLIKGSSDFDVSRITIDIAYGYQLSVESYLSAAGFNGGITKNKIDTSRAENELVSGGFNIGTLNIIALNEILSGVVSEFEPTDVILQNVIFYDAEGNEFSASPISTSINVTYESDTPGGLSTLNIVNGTITSVLEENGYVYDVTLDSYDTTTFGIDAVAGNSSDTITFVNGDSNQAITNPANIAFVPAGNNGKMTIKMNVGSATYTFIVTRPEPSSVEPATPSSGNTPSPSGNTSGNSSGNATSNPRTGGSAITMALVLIISFGLSIYLYKRNVEGYN